MSRYAHSITQGDAAKARVADQDFFALWKDTALGRFVALKCLSVDVVEDSQWSERLSPRRARPLLGSPITL
jgi:hypothetical protein